MSAADVIAWPRLPHGIRAADENAAWRYAGLQIGGTGHLRSFMTTDGVWLIVVTQLGIGCSVVNAAEDIYETLLAEYGRRLVYLEHWPSAQRGGSFATLDMVVATGRQPHWRRVWALKPHHPDYAEFEPWVHGDGAVVLDAIGWDGAR